MNFFEGLIPIFAIIFTFGIPGILIFFWIYSKHREKMRLIEKGISAEEAGRYFKDIKIKEKNPYSALKWGILLTFFGAGLIIGNILETQYDFDEGVVFGLIILFVGLGALLYYAILNFKLKSIPNNNSEVQTK